MAAAIVLLAAAVLAIRYGYIKYPYIHGRKTIEEYKID